MLTRAAYRILQRLRGSHSLALLAQIQPLQEAPADVVDRIRLQRLQALLRHAQHNVPYYRELFASLGASWEDFRSIRDLQQLPVLTKTIIRERGRDLVRDDVPLESLSAHHSGGSTGVPLTFYRDRRYVEASEAGTYRNLMRAGWRPGDMIAFFWGWNDRLASMPHWQFELRQRMRRMYQFDPFRAGPADMDRWVKSWRSIRPRVALGYASTIARFAEHIEGTGQSVPRVRGAFTTAEKLYPQQRDVIERVLGGRVFDCYGSSEVQNIAAECHAGRMHINADYVIVEEGEREAAAAAPPLLLTSLWSYAMPFIRYRNEDTGELLAGESCDCGCAFPLMALRIARVSDNFPLPGGRVVHGEFFTHLLYGSEGVDSFQFRQVALDRIELLIKPGAGNAAGRERAIAGAVREVEALAPGRMTVTVRTVDEIPLSAAGKHRFTRSDVDAAAVCEPAG